MHPAKKAIDARRMPRSHSSARSIERMRAIELRSRSPNDAYDSLTAEMVPEDSSSSWAE